MTALMGLTGFALIALSIALMVAGSGLGAYLGKVAFWKGPAVAFSGFILQAVVEVVSVNVTGSNTGIFGWLFFFAAAGLVAWLLHVPVKGFVLILVGAVLATIAFAIAVELIIPPIDVPSPDPVPSTAAP